MFVGLWQSASFHQSLSGDAAVGFRSWQRQIGAEAVHAGWHAGSILPKRKWTRIISRARICHGHLRRCAEALSQATDQDHDKKTKAGEGAKRSGEASGRIAPAGASVKGTVSLEDAEQEALEQRADLRADGIRRLWDY